MSIADLFEKEESIKGLVDMLCLFVLKVSKKDTNMYPLTRYFFLILLLFSISFICFLFQKICILVFLFIFFMFFFSHFFFL
jgi:hypothetical protein